MVLVQIVLQAALVYAQELAGTPVMDADTVEAQVVLVAVLAVALVVALEVVEILVLAIAEMVVRKRVEPAMDVLLTAGVVVVVTVGV